MNQDNEMNKKKRITSALDNFPAVKVLVVLVVIVVILQSYSAWKVIGLEGERVSLLRDIENFEKMQSELPGLNEKWDDLTKKINILKKNRFDLLDEKAKAEKTIAEAEVTKAELKRGKEIRKELELAAKDFVLEIQSKTDLMKKLTGPASQLTDSLDRLDDVVRKLKEAPDNIETALNQVKSVSDNLKSVLTKTEDIQSSLDRSIEDNNKAYKESLDASGKVSDAGTSISKATKLLNENASEFKQALEDVNKSMENVKESTQRLERITVDVKQTGSKARDAIESFDSIIRDIKNDNATAIKSMNRDIENIQKSSGKLSDIVEKIKLHTTDFNDKISEIKPSKYDRALSKHSNDIMEAAKTAGKIETQLKKLIGRIQNLTDESIGDFKTLRQELDSAKKRISKINEPINNEN